MPFRSEAQRRYLWANEPAVAREFADKTPKHADLPERVGKLKFPAISSKKLVGKMASGEGRPPVHGATGPADDTPEMPDFESIYAGPTAQKRMKQEHKQSEDRRRSSWRDYNFAGLHGRTPPDEPVLRYVEGETSTADTAIQNPRHYLTAKQLKQRQERIHAGLNYEDVQGQTKKRKKGKVG